MRYAVGGGESWGMGSLGGWEVLGGGMSYSFVLISEMLFGSSLITTAPPALAGSLASQVTGGVYNRPWPLLTSTCSSQTITFSIYMYMHRYIKTQNYIKSYTV